MNRLIAFYTSLIKNNLAWFKTTAIWFIATAIIGFVVFILDPSLMTVIVKSFQDRFGPAPALDIHLALQIFLQNVVVSLVAFFGGLLLGLGSLLIISFNGFLIGYVLASIFFVQNISFSQSLALVAGGLLPHGIFELPAFLLVGTLGLRLGLEYLSKNSSGQRWPIFKKNLFQGLINLPSIALVLFIAALIEVFVSGQIVKNF